MPGYDLLAFAAATTLLALAPGPDNIFVLTQSALYGVRSGVLVTLGLCTGLFFHTTAVTLGVATLVQNSPTLFNVIKLLGAAYLLYLAWQVLQAKAHQLTLRQTTLLPWHQLYLRGVIMNITNPKVTIFFLAFLPQFTSPEQGSIAWQMIILGILFMLITLIVFSSVALGASFFGTLLQSSNKAVRWLNRMTGLVFIALAVRLSFTSQ